MPTRQYIKKIIFFISLFVIYLILREFLELYLSIRELHPVAGYGFLIILSGFIFYLIIIPIYNIIKIPRNPGPARTKEDEQKLIAKRIENWQKNNYLKDFDFNGIRCDRKSYLELVESLEKQADILRRRHISQLFYSTAIAQNGFLDALFILSASINHIKAIFLLYNGRVSNRDLFIIGKKVYYSMAIGGSEGVEYATEEIFSKLASESLKSIPFIDKILSSLVDGLVNATLLTRISLITENYCKLSYIESEKDIYPSPKFVINTAKSITGNLLEKIFKAIRKMTLDRSINFVLVAANPIGYVLGKTIDKSEKLDDDKKERMKEHAKLVGNPLVYGLERLFNSIRRKH